MQSLSQRRRRAPNTGKVRADFDSANHECAVRIVQDPETFGGEDSLSVRWARQVLSNAAVSRADWSLAA